MKPIFRAVPVLLSALLPLCACWAAPDAAAPATPNILFILADDLGYGDVGVFFQNARAAANNHAKPWHLTPQLDTLAAEGIQMRQHYCPAPVCAPSRASFLLGVTQGHANVRDNQFDKALENNHTLATVLKAAGYATACIGKWGLQGSGGDPTTWPAYPTKRGFDYYFGYVRHGDGHEHYPKEGVWRGAKEVWDGTNEISAQLDKCYTADLWTARAKQWILDHQRTNAVQPFFLYLAYDTPHAVCEIPTQAYPAGGGTHGGLQWLGTPGHMITTASGTVDSYTNAAYANATYDDDNNAATPEVPWPYVYKRFATSVNRLDDCVGDLKQLLKDLNLDTNTFLVFTSDNGPSIESYLPQNLAANFFDSYGPFDGLKRDCWEGGLRVPTIVRWPGHLPAGTTNNLASGFWDWLPTFADLAGLPAPARSDGVSLLPSLLGAGLQRTPTVYVEYYESGSTPSYSQFLPAHRGRTRNQMQVIRLGDYLGVRYNVTAQADNFEIYNVVTDPQEGVNLATNAAYAALQQRMKDTVLQQRRPDSSAPRPYDGEHVPATNAAPLAPGVQWQTFTNAFAWVPELTVLPAAASGQSDTVSLAVRPRDNDIGVLFTGFIQAPLEGSYTFYLAANAGALLRIHEATVVEADFGYVPGQERSGTIKLKAGLHPYRLYFRHGASGAPALTWSWQGPNLAKQAVPASALFRIGVAPPGPPTANEDAATTSQGTPVVIDVLANDFDDGTPQPLRLQSVSQPAGGTCQIVANKVLYTPAAGFLGQDAFQYTLTDGSATASAQVTVQVYLTNSDFVWFPFNQTAGLNTTEAGGGLSASLNGFTDDTSPWVAGRFGRSIQFDGVATYVAIAPSYQPPSGRSPRTTAAWIRATSTKPGAILAWGPDSTSIKWMMRLDNGAASLGCLRLEIGGGYAVASQNLLDGQWHHVAAVLPSLANPNATNLLLYVDGVRQTQLRLSPSPINTTTATVTIGVDAQNRYFEGIIDEVRIYRRALSDAEVAALAAATNQCAAAWHRRYYGDGSPDWNSDSDSDSFSQGVEYAFGANPRVPDTPLPLQAQVLDGQFQLTYPRLVSGTTELNYVVESSNDLRSWAPAAGAETSTSPVLNLPSYEWATFVPTAPPADPNAQYFRVRSAFP